MTIENFRKAAKIMDQRSELIRQRDWCAKLISNFDNIRYCLSFPMEPSTAQGRSGTLDRLEANPVFIKEMLEKNYAWLETQIEDLTDQIEEL
jgi:hypothetical protein